MIRVEGLAVQAGTFRLSNIAFEVPGGKYGILMGRTGSGKTTILESLCGLKRVSAGRILLNGRDVTRLKPAERGIGFVPQDAALFPTMSVEQQLGFALTIRKWKTRDVKKRVDELADLLGIRELLSRSVVGLSGGERQRIALGRALAPHPSVLCLDEPLSALDEETRGDMYGLLKSVQQLTGVTALHITHNRSEARHLGDVLLTIEQGAVRPFENGENRKPSRDAERTSADVEEEPSSTNGNAKPKISPVDTPRKDPAHQKS